MSIVHSAGAASAADVTPEPERQGPDQPTVARFRPRRRVGAAWAGVYAAAVTAIALVIFMVQDTGRAIYFLWMHDNIFVALALLIAVIGAVVLTLILGTARITQLRHLGRRR
ncbi:MAG TPA: hypothetical protein VFW65_13125 [Pseudonocardiaceae bacterium]|nr:hypothetical protein [Pseudonocardiaceae bacterium]